MADSKDLQQIVESAVAKVLDLQLPKLRAEIVRSVMAALPSITASAEPAAEANPAGLVQAVSTIHAGLTQKEILKALLDCGSAYGAVEHCSTAAARMARASPSSL